jgi:hypothetical protein
LKLIAETFCRRPTINESALDLPNGTLRPWSVMLRPVGQLEQLELYHRVPVQGYCGNGCWWCAMRMPEG